MVAPPTPRADAAVGPDQIRPGSAATVPEPTPERSPRLGRSDRFPPARRQEARPATRREPGRHPVRRAEQSAPPAGRAILATSRSRARASGRRPAARGHSRRTSPESTGSRRGYADARSAVPGQVCLSRGHAAAFTPPRLDGSAGRLLYTIIQSCRRRGINPQDYLTDVLRRLPSMTAWQAGQLVPKRWKASPPPPEHTQTASVTS